VAGIWSLRRTAVAAVEWLAFGISGVCVCGSQESSGGHLGSQALAGLTILVAIARRPSIEGGSRASQGGMGHWLGMHRCV